MYHPTFEEFCKKAEQGNLIPVYKEILADLETPVSAFIKIDKGDYSFLLESVEGREKWARYSFLGSNPRVIIRADQRGVTRVRDGVVTTKSYENPLDAVKEEMSHYKPVVDEGLPRFFGGAVGYMTYDMVRYFEDVDIEKRGEFTHLPDLFFVFTDTMLIFDNHLHTIKVVHNAHIKDDDLKGAYEKAIEKIDGIVEDLWGPLKHSHYKKGDEQINLKWSSNVTKEEFIGKVEQAKEYIAAGDIFQVQISQRFSLDTTSNPFDIYRALRRINPSPYMFYLKYGDLHVVGSSPEVLVRLEGTRVETRPIAGTRRRGRSPEDDIRMEEELLSDPKERAEHIMLVDLGRNDIGRVCKKGSVTVNELMVIERYSHVIHLVSNVIGEIDPQYDGFDVLEACFPAGTVSGAPKIRSMEIIEELESSNRGLYAGSVGYFSFQGNMDTCITIRTIVIKGNKAYLQAAAGIVADSEPEKEYLETTNKMKGMVKAIEMAERGLE